MHYTCHLCKAEHENAPTCFGMDAPWRALVPENEFATRVELNADQCVVDEKQFFVRGNIEIPILGHAEPLSFSVWSSLNLDSFLHMCDRWDAADRGSDAPYFGWLCSPISVYPSTVHLKLSVQSRSPGLTPIFTVEESAHPLSIDQRQGISIQRWQEIVHHLLHNEGPSSDTR